MRDFPPLLTAAQMRAADGAATTTLGLPSTILMENAGRGVAEIARRELTGDAGGALPRGAESEVEVAVICGPGANGGDGFVIARHLARAGVPVRVALVAPRAKIAGDAALNLTALERMGDVPIADGSGWTDEAPWRSWLGRPRLIVDAIFGTGFRGPIAGVPAAALGAMNAARGRKVAVDVPSGLDADTGRAQGPVFRADVTATMGARKLGLYVDADAPVGRVEVVELGVPIRTGESAAALVQLLDEAGIADRLPRRAASAHKGSAGHLLVVAGAPGKTGAAVLVGQAGLRAGAGLVTLASTAPGQAALDAKVVELMTARYTDRAAIDPEQASAALTALSSRVQAIAIGPGIPGGDEMRAVVRRLASTSSRPMVLDADALNALGTEASSVLASAPAARVLTPHPAEMGRLAGLPTVEVQADRPGVARRLAAATRAVVVLKGARTVIAAPDGRLFVNPTACPALATAGSGDVLCGVVGALLAGGADALTAAQIAVFVHGAAGELLAGGLGDGVTAGDLPLAIATVIATLQRGEALPGSTRGEAVSPERAAPRPRAGRSGARRPGRQSPPRRRRRSGR